MPGDYDGDGQTDFAVWRPVVPDMRPVDSKGRRNISATERQLVPRIKKQCRQVIDFMERPMRTELTPEPWQGQSNNIKSRD